MIKFLAVAGFAMVLAGGILFIAGCSSGSQASSSSPSGSNVGASASSAIAGGWEVPATAEPVLAADQKEVYESSSGVDAAVQPIALLATQVVSGMNYAFLGNDGSKWSVVVCYKSIGGEIMVSSAKAIDLANIRTLDASAANAQPGDAVGGWAVQEPAQPAVLPDKAQAAFEKSLQGYTGIALKPIALLGTQIVSGTNYLVLCEGSPVVQNPTPGLFVVNAYEDLQGNAELTSVESFDLLYYIGN